MCESGVRLPNEESRAVWILYALAIQDWLRALSIQI